MACSGWPETTGWDCHNGGVLTVLDESMTNWQTSDCESLCYQRNTNGCCLLSSVYGCWWKDVATAIRSNKSWTLNSKAISCNFTGIVF